MKAPKWVAGLPEWAVFNEADGFVEVDPDVVYPLFLDGAEPSQVGLETARLKFTKILRDEIAPEDIRLNLRILSRPHWALINFPVGEGTMPSIAKMHKRM